MEKLCNLVNKYVCEDGVRFTPQEFKKAVIVIATIAELLVLTAFCG